MVLLNAGYFPTTYFPSSCWQPSYWQSYGLGAGGPQPPTVYTVTVVAATGGYASLGVGSHDYEDGTEISITAIPYDPDYTFTKLLVDGVEETDNPYTFTVTEDVTLTPVFTAVAYADTLTPFDVALLKMEQQDPSNIFDVALAKLEQIDPSTLFDQALLKLEATGTLFELQTDESVIFTDQVFDEEPFYED